MSREDFGLNYKIAVGEDNTRGKGWTHEFSFEAEDHQTDDTIEVNYFFLYNNPIWKTISL